MNNLKICFLAPSGYGKSTAIKLLSESYNIKNIKIAAPLYELQEHFYKFIEKDMQGEQDGELLQFLGKKIRKENPNFLLYKFLCQTNMLSSDYILVNDDARPPDFEFLKKLGFTFIKIKGFRHDRKDHSEIDSKSSIEWQGEIPFDYEVENTGSLEEYHHNLEEIFKKLTKSE